MRVRRQRRSAENVETQTLHLLDIEQERSSFIVERKTRLITQEELEPQLFLQAVDLAHQRCAGEAQRFGGVSEALMPRAKKKCPQIFP